MFYLVFPGEHVKETENEKVVGMDIQLHLFQELSAYELCEWIIYPSMKVSQE